jgi:hypothetical protein
VILVPGMLLLPFWWANPLFLFAWLALVDRGHNLSIGFGFVASPCALAFFVVCSKSRGSARPSGSPASS